jgi:spore coat protein A, manganese oxidase
LGLPAGDYEKAYAIQDRFFKENGELFYPAYKGEPYYDDFITGENANWDSDVDGPTILAEFFGDFMVVNGKIWPKQDVEPRRYRFRLLNGCDSRFLVLSFMAVDAGETSIDSGVPVMYTIVGADQGLQHKPIRNMTSSIIETGSRLDIVIDFSGYEGKRIILGNSAGDTPFSGDIPGEQVFEYTNMIMGKGCGRIVSL